MSVSSQIDLWMGPLETFKSIPHLGRLIEQLRWSGLSLETLIAPAFLVPEMYNPTALIKAYDHDISIAQMKSMTILGSLRIGSGPIIKEIAEKKGGQQYLIALNAMKSILAPVTVGTLFKLLINEMDHTTARRLDINTTLKTLNLATCLRIQSIVVKEMTKLLGCFDELLCGEVDFDNLVVWIRQLAKSKDPLRLPVGGKQTEIAVAMLTWALLDGTVTVHDGSGRTKHVLGDNHATRPRLELFKSSDFPTSAVEPSARWISSQFPYGIRSFAAQHVLGSLYMPAGRWADALLQQLDRSDPEVLLENIEAAWSCISHLISVRVDRALYDVLCQLDQWFLDHDSIVVPCEANHSCAVLIELFRNGKQAEICQLINSNRENFRRSYGPRCYWGNGRYRSVNSQDGLLLVAITLKAIEANVGGRFTVSTNLDLCVKSCDCWLTGDIIPTGRDSNRFNHFYELVTGLVPPPSCTTNTPVLVGMAGIVIYNDYDFSTDPHSILYCKVAEGAAYIDDELVEFVASTPAMQCICDSQAVKGQMLPLDLTPTKLNMEFSRGTNKDGEFNLEVVVEGSNGRHFLNTRNGLALWPNLVFALPPSLHPEREPSIKVTSPVCLPDLTRARRRVAAAFQNHQGRCIACRCCDTHEVVFLLVECGTSDGRPTYEYIARNTSITHIVY